MRVIDDILYFRSDLSPFLAHLTRAHDGLTARDSMLSIIQSTTLRAGPTLVSDARFGGNTASMTDPDKKRFFAALCFTETPLNEIHTLLDIQYRQVNLEPWGLVFMREQLQGRGVAPVVYLNNRQNDMGPVIAELFKIKDTAPGPAAQLLPLISIFGNKVTPPGARPQVGQVDWRWEREWRYPAASGDITFSSQDVFVGLCPDDEIPAMEQAAKATLPGIEFVDPRRNMKWYATKLIAARQRLNMKYSVV